MSRLQEVQHKIFPASGCESLARLLRQRGGRVVFTNGCFDLLHRGHVHYLSQAADLGDVLVIGLNTDASVRRLKGEHRPINDETGRAEVLAALSFVDFVIPFDEDTPLELIRCLCPDVLVKGGDYLPDQVVGAGFVEGRGGQVVIIPFLPDYSTSGIEQRIREGRDRPEL